MKVIIIDYGMGNLRSVERAFKYLGVEAMITSDSKVIQEATHIVLPGVGAFSDAMKELNCLRLTTIIKEEIVKGKAFLGICLGMQLLFEKSYENGMHRGLDILPGEVVKLDTLYKVPHVGWNTLEVIKKQPLLDTIPKESAVYFVHSYQIETKEDIISSYTTYGQSIPASIQKDRIFATQFHPEKSGKIGLEILKKFIQI